VRIAITLLGERSTIDVLGFRGCKEALVFAPKLLVKAGAILLGNFRSPVYSTPIERIVCSHDRAFKTICTTKVSLHGTM
jgi:hypothetical protein